MGCFGWWNMFFSLCFKASENLCLQFFQLKIIEDFGLILQSLEDSFINMFIKQLILSKKTLHCAGKKIYIE